MEYQEFIESKKRDVIDSGFEIAESDLNKYLFPHQRRLTALAIKKGKFALFEDCGLGKTIQQLVWADEVRRYTKGKVIILTHLGVVAQTIEEAKTFEIKVGRTIDSDIFVTSYSQLENIDCSLFSGVVLDESSILKNYNGATKQLILDKFKETKFKLACSIIKQINLYKPSTLICTSKFQN